MSYYDDLLKNIDILIKENQNKEALKLINNELEMPYVPSDVENKLKQKQSLLKEDDYYFKSLNDEDIEKYLFGTYEQQLIAVEQLNNKNLRDYIDLINNYLCSEGLENAKVLLIDSLINQEISNEIRCIKNGLEYTFIPRYLLPIEESDGFKEALKILEDNYFKEPSKLKLAQELLFKECILYLPLEYEKEEGKDLAFKIIDYLEKAFEL